MPSARRQEYDVLIIGAGLSGLSSIYNVRKRFPSWTVRVLEAAPSVGGTWYWNCYPGARFDSESVSYQLSWDKEFLQQWDWSETFAAQGETLRYIRGFTEKNDLEKDIQFDTTIDSARWLDDEQSWLFVDYEYQGRFFISCLGILSNPALPNIHGLEKFSGQAFHTLRFPRNLDVSRDLAGKRVGVIGTGATGIQTSTAIAQGYNAKSLSVFQRTATWAAPLRNKPISREEMDAHKADSDNIFKRCALTSGCFSHQPDPRKSNEVTTEERLAL